MNSLAGRHYRKQSDNTFTKQGEQDWGGRYIDVDLTTQHAVLYGDDGTILWEADD